MEHVISYSRRTRRLAKQSHLEVGVTTDYDECDSPISVPGSGPLQTNEYIFEPSRWHILGRTAPS
jgi:hypothetical protein